MPSKIVLNLKSKAAFELSADNGHFLYAAILNKIESGNSKLSVYLHDLHKSSFSISALCGNFRACKNANYGMVIPGNIYDTRIGIIDQQESELFRTIINQLFLSDLRESEINLNGRIFEICGCQCEDKTFEQILKEAQELSDTAVRINFKLKTPTCIKYKNSTRDVLIFDQASIFTSLLSKWNGTCPDELKISFDRDDISRYLLEKPNDKAYRVRSVVVDTYFDKKTQSCKPSFKNAFMGECEYRFAKEIPKSIKEAVLALSIFAEYSGVGSAVSRGCGCAEIDIFRGG